MFSKNLVYIFKFWLKKLVKLNFKVDELKNTSLFPCLPKCSYFGGTKFLVKLRRFTTTIFQKLNQRYFYWVCVPICVWQVSEVSYTYNMYWSQKNTLINIIPMVLEWYRQICFSYTRYIAHHPKLFIVITFGIGPKIDL